MKNSHLQRSSRNGTDAVQQLRKTRLSKGLPFMINSTEVGENSCYLEYPDGTITKVAVSKSGVKFQTLQTLSEIDASNLRTSFFLV
jgi:hypothetical protein